MPFKNKNVVVLLCLYSSICRCKNCYLFFSVHAAIIAINEAIESQVTSDIIAALGNPAAMLLGISDDLGDNYATHLYEAKQTKAKNAKNKVNCVF